MASPPELRYTKEHEWVRLEPDTGAGRAEGTVGITDYAQDQLGDIVFVELPDAGTQLTQMEKFGEIESVKAVSELFSPVTGEVIDMNRALADRPELVNESPYGEGWMLRVRLDDASQVEKLLTAEEYDALVEQSKE